MGNPVFRFTLTHDTLGTQAISEPDGWKNAKLKLERHPEYHSLVEYFDGSFIFYGENNYDNGGADFIRQVESRFGHDAEIQITIQADIDGDGVFEETLFTGQLDLSELQELSDNKIEVPIIRDDFWSKFISRKDTPVNLRSTTNLDGNTTSVIDLVNVNLTGQKIVYKYKARYSQSVNYSIYGANTYGIIDFDSEEIREIKEKYTYPRTESPTKPNEILFLELSGGYVFNILVSTVLTDLPADQSNPSSHYYDVKLQINNEIPINFAYTNHTVDTFDEELGCTSSFQRIITKYTFNNSLSLEKSDEVRIYIEKNGTPFASGNRGIAILGDDVSYQPCSNLTVATTIEVIANTTYPSSSAQTYLIHDAANSITNRTTGQLNSFYSEYFGSTLTNGRTYSQDGCAWKNVIIQGLQIRGYTFDEKQLSMSFDKWWKGANPMFNLGLGYETINGIQVIRVEDKYYFYNPTSVSVYLSNVRQITREYDQSKIYNRIEVGFSKWQSEDISGLDDPQTKRVWATRIQKTNNALTLHSDFIAASVAIEVTRRQTIEKSKDYKYDNDIFIIAINPDDVSPDRYRPELNENFSSITGLLNYDTRYNCIHTPLRMLFRWADVWNGCLQKYQSSSLKFVSGEGNYDMSSDYNCSIGDTCLAVVCDNFSEKGDVNLSTYGQGFGYLHLPQLYTIEVINFTWDDYLAIRNNRNKAISISQTETNYKRFFIKELIYEVCKGKCKITAWPYDESPILVIDTVIPERECPVVIESCGDRVRLLEDGDERITEDGECRTLEDGSSIFFYSTSEITSANEQYFYNTSEITSSNDKYFYNSNEI